jgi:hypothetical protein
VLTGLLQGKARRRGLDDDDDALEKLAAATLAEIKHLGAEAAQDEYQLWPTAIEEIEYGI